MVNGYSFYVFTLSLQNDSGTVHLKTYLTLLNGNVYQVGFATLDDPAKSPAFAAILKSFTPDK
jgi:hypothetical protein